MPTIKELVNRFSSDISYSDREHEIAKEWMIETRCGEIDVSLLTKSKQALDKRELHQRKTLKKETVRFIKQYFDERPDVVRTLDELFATFGLENENARRREFFRFEDLYSQDEIRVLLLKHLQPKNGRRSNTHEDIADYFTASSRAIGDHIRNMYPTNDINQGAKIFGRAVQMDPERGTNIPESTTHPIFLPLQMVELYALVDILQEHSGNEIEGRIVRRLLQLVLDQTTEYANERLEKIEGVSETLRSLPTEKSQIDLGEAILFSEKERRRAIVRYDEDGEERVCEGFISRSYPDRTFVDVNEGCRTFHIPYSSIIKLTTPDK